jgi:ribosomal protein S18 acetylase RimI-like enzyme
LGAHAYGIADLDDFFWPTTTAWADPLDRSDPSSPLAAAVLLIEKLSPPILYALCPDTQVATARLLEALLPELPDCFFFNIDVAHLPVLEVRYRVQPGAGVVFQKMTLGDSGPPAQSGDTPPCEIVQDAAELAEFYRRHAYAPHERDERFLEPYMLEMEPYLGIRESAGGPLVAAGGVHLVSERYGVAALGNIATRPDARSRGYSRAIVGSLCRSLTRRVSCITLNVAVDNDAAIRSYAAAGFLPIYRYLEGRAEAR